MRDAFDQIAAGLREQSRRDRESSLTLYRITCFEKSDEQNLPVEDLKGFDSKLYELASEAALSYDIPIESATKSDAELEASVGPLLQPLRECDDLREVAELLGLNGTGG